MAEKIVECVPNFSEGRDLQKIESILDAVREVDGVEILDVDPGFETNRTVVTLVGKPAPIEEAAFRAIRRAAEVIDMAKHKGAHPRHGATDVCPFVPVSGVSMEECVQIARSLGERVGDELGIPVYLYDQAAQKPERRSLARVRQGEYEALVEKLKTPGFRPDYGPAEFHSRAGVVTIGAREFLIAYNVNLNSSHQNHAADIAYQIREKGRAVRTDQTTGFYASGQLLRYYPSKDVWPCALDLKTYSSREELIEHYRRDFKIDFLAELDFFGQDPEDLEGKYVMKRGRFQECRAVGWMIPEYRRAQISINLTNYKVTSMHDVLEECRRQAEERGLVATGSEIVGVVPYRAIRESGEFYLQRQGSSRGVPANDVIEVAVQSLGLRDVAEFDPQKSVLGLPRREGELAAMRLCDLADEVSRATPTPGGGSISAVAGALAAALASMVANLTHQKKKLKAVHPEMEQVAIRAQELKDALLAAVDEDTRAFNEVIAAMRLPKGNKEEVTARNAAIQTGYQHATEVPLETATFCLESLRLCQTSAAKGLASSVTDAAVGALLAHAGLRGAVLNVRINLESIEDREWVTAKRSAIDAMCTDAETVLREIESRCENAF